MNKLRGRTFAANLEGTSIIDAGDIATGAVTTAKIATSAVTTAKIATSAVTVNQIGDGAVTVDQIGSLAVTTAKIAANAVTAAKLYAAAERTQKYQYSAATMMNTASAVVTLTDASGAAQQIPDQALVLRASVEGVYALETAEGGEVKLGITGSDAAFVGLTDHATFANDYLAAANASLPLKATAAKDVIFTIGTAALTTGLLNVYVTYIDGQEQA